MKDLEEAVITLWHSAGWISENKAKAQLEMVYDSHSYQLQSHMHCMMDKLALYYVHTS